MILLALFLAPLAVFAGCGGEDAPEDARITFTILDANGNHYETTTKLFFIFSEPITGFNAADITLTGAGVLADVTKGALTGDGPGYTLEITDVKAIGFLTVRVNKSGYRFLQNDWEVQVFYYDPDIESVEFLGLTANGSSGTTSLTLTFNKAIPGLSAGDIFFSGGAQAATGTLSGTGPVYTLEVIVTTSGVLTVTVQKTGFTISPALDAEVIAKGEFLAFSPPEIYPFRWGGEFAYSLQFGFDATEGAWWAEHAKTFGNGLGIFFGFRAPNEIALNWSIVDPDNPAIKYDHSFSYELKISDPDLVDDFANFNVYINWTLGQEMLTVDDLPSVKESLKANPEEYTKVMYIIPSDMYIHDTIDAVLFYWNALTEDDIPGRVSIRNIRFYPQEQ